MQVNLNPLTVVLDLNFAHLAPAFTAANAVSVGTKIPEITRVARITQTRLPRDLFIAEQ
jgi:hypothetical protein